MTSRTGTIIRDGETATIRFERRLPYPIEAVWTALTDPAQRGRWLGPTTIDPRLGGRIETVAEGPPVPPQHRSIAGRILAWDPPRLFEHEWHQSIIGETVVRYELQADGDGTLLRFSHSGLRPRDAEGFIPGTHAYLDRLQALLGSTPLPVWTDRYAEVQPVYGGAWSGPPG